MDKKKKSSSSKAISLDPSLAKLVLESESNKIRRPPNAFMIFGRENRKIVSKLHPNVNNKTISSILGKLWKECSEDSKKKYYEKAKLLGDLHKRRFPDYVYSPRDARMKKMMREKKKGDSEMELSTVRKTKIKQEEVSVDEDKTVDTNLESQSSPDYVPNNPGFIVEQSPESLCEENQCTGSCDHYPVYSEFCKEDSGEMPINTSSRRMHSDMDCGCCMTPESAGCYGRNNLETNTKDMPQQRMLGRTPSHFSDCLEHHPRSYTLPLPFGHNSGHFPGSIRCNSSPDPQVYRSQYHPYWHQPIIPQYLQGTNSLMCDDSKSFPYAASTEFYGPPPRYFERSFTPNCRSSSFGVYPQCKEDLEFSQRSQNAVETEHSDLPSCFSRSNENYQNLSYPYAFYSRMENGDYAQNKKLSIPNIPHREYLQTAGQLNLSALNSDASNDNNKMPSSSRRNPFKCNRKSHSCTQISGDKDKDSSDSHQQFFNVKFQGTQRTHLQPANNAFKNNKSADRNENSSNFPNEKCKSNSSGRGHFFLETSVQRRQEVSSNTVHKDCNEPLERISNENYSEVASSTLQSDQIPIANQESSMNVSLPQMPMPEIKGERISPDSSFTYDGNCAVGTSTVESCEPNDSQETTGQADESTETYYAELICESDQSNQSDTYSNSLE